MAGRDNVALWKDHWDRAEEKGQKLAAKAAAGTPQTATVSIKSRNNLVAGAVESAMERRGYKFAAWRGPTLAVYRHAPDELQREHEVRQDTLASVRAYMPTQQNGELDLGYIRLTRTGVILDPAAASSVPLSVIRGLAIAEDHRGKEWPVLVCDMAYNDEPKPTLLKLAPTDLDRERLAEATGARDLGHNPHS